LPVGKSRIDRKLPAENAGREGSLQGFKLVGTGPDDLSG